MHNVYTIFIIDVSTYNEQLCKKNIYYNEKDKNI